MRGEDRVWMGVVVATVACVLGVFAALVVTDFNISRERAGTSEPARTEVDESLERIGASIGRLDAGINFLQVEVLRTRVSVLERALERCGCCCGLDEEFVPVGRAGDNEDPDGWVPNEEEVR